MSIDEQPRPGLKGAIDTAYDFGQVVRSLDALTAALRAERRHDTAEMTNELGQFVNDTLFVGGAQLNSQGTWRKTFRAPFASVTIADANGSGPFLVGAGGVNLSSGDLTADSGVGNQKWLVAQGTRETIPLSGRELDVIGAANAKLYVVCHVSRQPYTFGPSGEGAGGGASVGPESIAASAASVVLQAANVARTGLLVVNADPASNLYLTYGATSSVTLYTVKLVPGAYWEMPTPVYAGVVSGIWDGAPSTEAFVTEVT